MKMPALDIVKSELREALDRAIYDDRSLATPEGEESDV